MATREQKSTPPLLAMAHPMAFSAYLRRIGSPVERYMRRNGLPVLCEDPKAFVPLQRVWSFFDTAARQEDPMLGWRVGAYIGDQNLNSGLLRKLGTAPTLLLALRGLARMVSAEASDLNIGIHERQADVLLYMCYVGMRGTPGHMISQAYQLEIIVDLIRHFLGRHWIPTEIGIESSLAPSVAEAHFPGCRILTEQQSGYIAVPRSGLHRSALIDNAKVDGLENPPLAKNFDYTDTLRSVLKSYLSEGYPSARFAAELMNTSVRTLSRRLSTDGLTYGALIDELRFKSAKELLQNPGVRIVDVAQSVGFNDQGDFTRMFRRIGGLTPLAFRNAGREQ
jgi:AraC-like DNA-binding protein